MNHSYFKISDELKMEFHKAFTQDDDEKIFLFFRKLLQYIENDDSPYSVLLCFENPLKDEENAAFMKDFGRICSNFLEERVKNRSDQSKRHTTGTAMCYLGVAYEYALFGYPLDYESAYEHYLIASQLNNQLGTYKLAQCYEMGKGTDRDTDQALYFYRCAAKLGLTDALHTYGSILSNGYLGAEVDEKTGLHYLSLAAIKADKIYPYPLFDIGKWYETKNGALDVPVDEKYSFGVYLKGANLNDPNCQYRVAKCLENGELKKRKNLSKAIGWYKRAAESGQIDAQLKLFGYYSSGIGKCLKRDLGLSYFWALRAGTKGCARAMFYLGEFSMSGSGIRKDILLALWWYTISSSMGSREGAIKMKQTRDEVRKRDAGPQISPKCCGIFYCKY